MDNIFLFDPDQHDDSNHQGEQSSSDGTSQTEQKHFDSPFIFEGTMEQSILTERKPNFSDNEEKKSTLDESQVKVNQSKKNSRPKNIIWNEEEQQEEEEQVENSKTIDREKREVEIPGITIKREESSKFEYIGEKKALRVTDIKQFLHHPLGEFKIRAVIKKEESGLFNTNTKYTIKIQQNNRFMMSILRNGLSNYIFSLSRENINTKNRNYLGSMVGNMSGTVFILYDNGFNPNETRSLEYCRKQLASIYYEESKGPRKFQVLIASNSKGPFALEQDEDLLKKKWGKKQKNQIKKLYSRMPEFDPRDGNYKMDFKGIVKEASVKNFILGEDGNDSLIFGKVDNQTFIMEIKEPFSVFQAAAICISSIHYKLHWA